MAEQPDTSHTTSPNQTDSELNAAAAPFEFRPSEHVQAAAAPAAPVRSYASVVARDLGNRSPETTRSSTSRNRGPPRNAASARSSPPGGPNSAAPRRNPSSTSLSFSFNPNAQPFFARPSSSPETPAANPNAQPFIPRSNSPATAIPEAQENGEVAAKDGIAHDKNHQLNASSTAEPAGKTAAGTRSNGFHSQDVVTNGIQGSSQSAEAPKAVNETAAPAEAADSPAAADPDPPPPAEEPTDAAPPSEQPAEPPGEADISDTEPLPDSSHGLPHISPLAQSAEQMRQGDAMPVAASQDRAASPTSAPPLSPRPRAPESHVDSPAVDRTAVDDTTSTASVWPPQATVNEDASRQLSAASEHALRDVDGTLSAASGLHAAMGDSGGAMLVGAMSSGLTPRALTHSMQQHERSVSRLRTVVHHEIVRALQQLTLTPVVESSGARANGSTGGEISLAGGVPPASEQPQSADSGGEAMPAARMELAACMDHFVARAHADSITAHTHSAFQKLDDRTADPEAVACNYCRAVMVDVLAVAASWRTWIVPHCTSPAALDTLAAQHGRCIDILTSVMPAGSGLSEWYAGMCERGDDPFKDEEEPGGDGKPVRVAEGVVTAGAEVKALAGVQLKRVGAVPWVAEAAKAGHFEAQVRTAALRMLRSAMGSGEGLVVVAREFRAESGRDSGAGGDAGQRHGIARTGSGYTGAAFVSRGSRALGSGVQDEDAGLDADGEDDGDGDGGEDTDDGEDDHAGTRGADAGGEDGDGDPDDSAPRGRLSWGTSQELGVTSGGAGGGVGPRAYMARMGSGGASSRRARPRQPRACLSPTAVPPANISFATLVSPEATPRGRRPWFRSGEALAIGKQQTLGVLEPQHPKLRPIVVQEPGVALGCALPNEAQQHLTLTQQDGSEPLWRAGVHSAEVAQRGLPMITILDSRVAYIHCIIGPDSSVTSAGTPLNSPPPGASSPSAATAGASAMATSTDSSGPLAGDATPDAPVAFVLARALTGLFVNSRRIEHGVRAVLRDGDTLTIVPQSSCGQALSYTFRAGDPTARLIPPHASVSAALPPLHSIPLCQICGGLPRDCLELQPCGHTFCAACLSHKFAFLLSTASHLACPHGCPQPESINQCPDTDALVAALPEYLQRLARVVDWRTGRQESENGDSASAPFGSPRSPNWAGRSLGGHSATSTTAAEGSAAEGLGTGTLSTFERFVESLGPDAWQHTPRAALLDAARPGATRHESGDAAAADAAAEGGTGSSLSGSSPPFATAAPPFMPDHPGRPAVISELVPLTRDMLPLSMQELQAQQSDVSANVVKSAAECGCEMKELRIVIRHLYVLMHAAMMSSLWKEELNRAGTVEDSAAAARAVVQAARCGRTGAPELGGELGQQLLCAAATMICSLVLTQQPGMEEVCQGNQWRAARANVVEVLVEALDVWPNNHAVAHSCLQCLVALCKDNAMMKANVTVAALKPVVHVLQNGGARFAIAERGFTLLAVLQAGGDHLNDGVRRLLSEAGLQDAAIKALRAHAAGDERALTAVCFAIAMILRGGEKWRESVKWAAARNALLSSITKAERAYRFRCRAMRVPPDDALSALLAFLVLYLEPVQKAIKGRRKATRKWTLIGASTVALATLLARVARQPPSHNAA